MTSIESIIAKIEAELKEALDQIETYEYRVREARQTADRHQHTLGVLRAALNGSAAAQAFDEPAPAPEPEPAPEVAAAPSPLPTAVGASGFDRAAIKRQLREWHIRYPVGRSYHIPSLMMRQAQIAAIMDHPGYRADWLANGGVNLGDSNLRYTVKDLDDAAAMLGIDVGPIHNAAHKVQRLLAVYGVPGVDHHWERNP